MIYFKLLAHNGSTVDAVGFLVMTIVAGGKKDDKGNEVVITSGLFSVFWREDSPDLKISIEDLRGAGLSVSKGDPYARFFDKYVVPRLKELGLDNHVCALTLLKHEEEEIELWIADEPIKVDAATLIKRLGLSPN
jgi:hypothetical protein